MIEPKTPNTKNVQDAEGAGDTTSSGGGAAEATPVNLQKRKADVEPTRYGDWELNGRCIDF